MPTGIVISRPIIPTSGKEPFDDPDWLFECKYDGFRALYHLERGRCRIVSRRGNVLDRFAAFGEQLASSTSSCGVRGRPPTWRLISCGSNGADLRPLPLSERRQRLLSILPNGSAVIVEALSVQGRGHELFELMRDH